MQQPYQQQQQERTELPPKLPMWHFGMVLLHCLLLYWFVREGLLWHVPGLDSVFENALQNAKQLFHISLPQMTKYCVMREY
jgi:hypothetical protein